MSIAYTPATNFGAKDNLPTNDPAKVIKGSEFTTEFTAIQTAFGLAAPAASPTFTGTVTISSVDINGGTIDGVTIGGSSAGAGSFTTLTASGDVNFDSGTFFVDASADAVGIGTSSPSAKLHSAGAASSTTEVLRLQSNTNSAEGDKVRLAFSSQVALDGAERVNVAIDALTTSVTSSHYGQLAFSTMAAGTLTERMRIDASGNVGIGVVPSAWSVLKGFQVGTASTTYDSNDLYFRTNFYYGGAGFNYINSYFACMYAQVDGSHRWSTAASGTAGNAISFSEAMRIDSSGNVGIGTSSPTQLIHGKTGSGNAYMRIERASQSAGQVGLQIGGGTSSVDWFTYMPASSNDLAFFGNSAERMRIDSSGNVGLGVVPSAWVSTVKSLDVNTGASFVGTTAAASMWSNAFVDSGSTFKYKTSAEAAYYSQGSGAHAWYTAPSGTAGNTISFTQAMTLDASGNLGIGTSSPAAKLHVNGDILIPGSSQKIYGSATTGNRSYIEMYNAATGDMSLVTTFPTASVVFGTNSSERMRIDSSGNLLVGTQTTGFINDNGWTKEGASVVQRHSNAVTSGTAYTWFTYNGGSIGSITQSGTTAVAYNTSSDARLKENIADAESASERIDAIQVRQFDWKADGSHQDYGMIAQELLTVAPEAVSGDPESDDMMGVDYSKLVPMMLKEIQSLRARVAQLEGV